MTTVVGDKRRVHTEGDETVSSNETALIVQPLAMPALTLQEATRRYGDMRAFVQNQMMPGKDFGAIPGTDKPTLLKPGAEKLCTFFGLRAIPTIVAKVEDWEKGFFYYLYRYELWKGDVVMAAADGSCNSMDAKYRWRWVSEFDIPSDMDKARLKTRGGRAREFAFAIERAETTGKYGKPPDYWQQFKDAIATGRAVKTQVETKRGLSDAWEIDATLYRIPNDDVYSLVNTIQKIAQKRALVAATLIGTNGSEYFTQDMEDMEESGQVVEGMATVVSEPPVRTESPVAKGSNGHAKAPPAEPPSGDGKLTGTGIKIQAKSWMVELRKLVADCPHYGEDGKPNINHVLNAIAILNFPTVTDQNIGQVMDALKQRVADKDDETRLGTPEAAQSAVLEGAQQ